MFVCVWVLENHVPPALPQSPKASMQRKGKNIIQNPRTSKYLLFMFLLVTGVALIYWAPFQNGWEGRGLPRAPTYGSHVHRPYGHMDVLRGEGVAAGPLGFLFAVSVFK